MKTNKDQLSLVDFCNLDTIKRWQIVETSKTQSVAEHTMNVMFIADWIWQTLHDEEYERTEDIQMVNWDIRRMVMEAVLYHDVDELITGDIPTPIKAMIPKDSLKSRIEGLLPEVANNKFPAAVLDMVKLADLLEASSFLERYGVDQEQRSEICSSIDIAIDYHIQVMSAHFRVDHNWFHGVVTEVKSDIVNGDRIVVSGGRDGL